jgi:hypothetical protein
MDELRYTYATRYLAIDGKSTPVFTRVVHRPGCRYAENSVVVGLGQDANLRLEGFDNIKFNVAHLPQRSVWRACKVCNPRPLV